MPRGKGRDSGPGGEVISIHGSSRVPTGRKKKSVGKGIGGYGDLDPPNKRLDLLLKGVLQPIDLDNEELSAGIPKCDDGKFSEKAALQAARLPAGVQKSIQQELFKRADNMLSGALLDSIQSIIGIATNDAILDDGKPIIEPKDRLKASIYVLERLKGKTPDVIVHSQDKPWEIVLDEVETTTREFARQRRKELENAVDAELVDDGNEPWADLVDDDEDNDEDLGPDEGDADDLDLD